MAADRNIGNTGTSTANTTPSNGIFPQGSQIQPNANLINWAWSKGDQHQASGNVLLADGSVQQVTVSGLRQQMQAGTNSVSNPVWNFYN